MAKAGAAAGAIVFTTLLEVLIFLGDKETTEYAGRKHIKAADLLTEMARKRAEHSTWNNKAAIEQCQKLQEQCCSVVGGNHTIRQ
jgi:hypothetical protein